MAVDKTRNMELPGTSRNIPEHRIIMIIMRKIRKIQFWACSRDDLEPSDWSRDIMFFFAGRAKIMMRTEELPTVENQLERI